MPNINLIAARREEKKKLERIASQLFVGLGASVGALLLLASFMGARHFQMNSELAGADQRMQKIQPTLDEIDRIEKERNALIPKLDQLEAAKAQTLRWQAVFLALSKATPSNTWLSQVSSSEGDSPTITLQGQTDNEHLVSDITQALAKDPVFLAVDLKNTSAVNITQNDVAGKPVQMTRSQFEIQARVKPVKRPEPPVKDTPKEGPKTAMAGGGSQNG
jgi:Tfp pilus assembly protein PilN